MGATNKTEHYRLSQYIGSDKPSYLLDYNNDMSKIDNALYEIGEAAVEAKTSANALTPKVEALETTAAEHTNEIGEQGSRLTTAEAEIDGIVG